MAGSTDPAGSGGNGPIFPDPRLRPASADQRHRFVLEGVFYGSSAQGSQSTPCGGLAKTTAFHRDVNSTEGPEFHEVNFPPTGCFPIYRERVRLEFIGEA